MRVNLRFGLQVVAAPLGQRDAYKQPLTMQESEFIKAFDKFFDEISNQGGKVITAFTGEVYSDALGMAENRVFFLIERYES